MQVRLIARHAHATFEHILLPSAHLHNNANFYCVALALIQLPWIAGKRKKKRAHYIN